MDGTATSPLQRTDINAMGYQRSTLKLKFEDPEMDGLEVSVRRLSVKDAIDVTKLVRKIAENKDDGEALEALAYVLSRTLISWNVEDEDGKPIPTTLEGVKSIDPELIREISDATRNAQTGVSRPLSQPSSDGEPSPELSIPMETLSESPVNSETPD
jgi:hypothetical protein